MCTTPISLFSFLALAVSPRYLFLYISPSLHVFPSVQYKFVVDEEWTHDSNLPTCKNDIGSKNNVIDVRSYYYYFIFIFNLTTFITSVYF